MTWMPKSDKYRVQKGVNLEEGQAMHLWVKGNTSQPSITVTKEESKDIDQGESYEAIFTITDYDLPAQDLELTYTIGETTYVIEDNTKPTDKFWFNFQ